MVPGNRSQQLCVYATTSPSDVKTISISIRRASDDRSSSIMLPREHHIARHLERLLTYDTPSPQSQAQPLAQQPGYDVVRALSAVVKYIHATNSRHEAPESSLTALFNSLRPPSVRVNASVTNHAQANQRTGQHLPDTAQQSATHTWCRRSSSGRSRSTKHCKVIGCGNISVSRGLCRRHGGGRRCHYVGCSKSAQSRSVFCWAHGDGHRCEVESCMRSRKSRCFCVDHVYLENDTKHTIQKGINSLKLILNGGDEDATPTELPRNASLPSLRDVLRISQFEMHSNHL